MNIIKDTILDLVVLLTIISLAFYESNIQIIIIWIYTGLLLTGKILAFFMPSLQKRANKTSAPDWVYHLIYFLAVSALLYVRLYYLAGIWLLIWGLSTLISRKNKPKGS